ncbi:PHD-finger domain-containing protein [Xylogone sp. PMI_703]|nr:PHD-finger domain-containing protein [Xylogone sp. PMI_703]
MTERLLSITTQIATPIQTPFHSTPSLSTAPQHDAHTIVESVDEEPYTIKCICDFSDDDGNTIYCETCDTWQHIECFYPGRVDDASREEFDHSCADCKPRPLDRKHATERQRHQRENKIPQDSPEKKAKRPPSKSHKRKSKPSDLQVNGYHDADGYRNGSPQDHHPHAKKTKGHRSSHSISSQAKRSPPLPSHSRSNTTTVIHPPSPARTPQELLPYGLPISAFSETFQHLYKDDPGPQTVPTNSFANLNVPNAMSLWLKDPEKLQQDAGVKSREDVFQNLTVPVDKLKWRELRVERKEATLNGMQYQWRYLTTPTQLGKSGLRIGELNGLVGFQKDYCSDKENRWNESIHPRPFIFFHPHLPLFIDTRKEGSICRYVRRSCRANATLETYIAGDTEYHFWLVSERPLAANEQITLSWDFRFPSQVQSRFMHVLDLGEDDGSHHEGADLSDEEYEQLSNVISGVLADYGGCACDLGSDCAFVRFLNRNLHGRSNSQEHANGNTKPKKSRRPKLHVSPTSTGHATNSRAASEGQQESYDAEDDSHSVSGSSRSKPQSRDLTPLHIVAEPNGILTEPSDREKRKLAMLEDTFKKMEQPPRKKKRASDGPRGSISNPSGSAKNGVNGNKGKQYVDAATSQRQSGSPFSGVSPTAVAPSPRNPPSRPTSVRSNSRQPSVGPKSNYVDASTQTNDVENDWYSPEKTPLRKRSIVSLSKRLLKNRHKIRRSLESQQAESQQVVTVSTTTMDLDPPQPADHDPVHSPAELKDSNALVEPPTMSAETQIHSDDVDMLDAPAVVDDSSKPPPPQSTTENGAADALSISVDGHNPVEPQEQVPTSPVLSASTIISTPTVATPSSTTTASLLSPFSTLPHQTTPVLSLGVNGVSQPSPIKTTKKLSLSDYKARLKRTDSAINKPIFDKSTGPIEDAKANGIIEESVMIDTPVVEKTDPLTVVATPAAEPVTNIASESNGNTVK